MSEVALYPGAEAAGAGARPVLVRRREVALCVVRPATFFFFFFFLLFFLYHSQA